jgi:hexulose-6-phosphate isomerase
MKKIGIVQGRLSPSVDNQIQAFPIDTWKEEFPIYEQLGICCIDWLFKYETVTDNPLSSDYGIEQIKELCNKYNVKINAVLSDYFMVKRLFGEETDESIKNLYFLIDQCDKCGIPNIVLPFVDNAAIKTEEDKKQIVENLTEPIRYANNKSINIIIEGSLEPSVFRSFIISFKPLNVKINYDMGNSTGLGYDPGEEIRLLGEFFGSIHIKDKIKSGETVPLGTGDVDFKTVFNELKNIDYSGSFILETARQDLADSEIKKDRMETIKNYISFIKPYLEGFE